MFHQPVPHASSRRELDQLLELPDSQPNIKLFPNLDLHIKDLMELKPTVWLNDAVVDAFTRLIPAKDDVFVCKSFVNQVAQSKEAVQPLSELQPHITKVFVPCHVRNNHFYFVVLNKPTQTVFVCDSLQTTMRHYALQLDNLLQSNYISTWWGSSYHRQFLPNYPQQNNQYSCGVYVAIGIWRLACGLLFDHTYNDMEDCKSNIRFASESPRTFIGRCLLEQRILEDVPRQLLKGISSANCNLFAPISRQLQKSRNKRKSKHDKHDKHARSKRSKHSKRSKCSKHTKRSKRSKRSKHYQVADRKCCNAYASTSCYLKESCRHKRHTRRSRRQQSRKYRKHRSKCL